MDDVIVNAQRTLPDNIMGTKAKPRFPLLSDNGLIARGH